MAKAKHDHDHDHDHPATTGFPRVEALKNEGVHRAGPHEGPFSLHVLGLGKTGADIIAQLLKTPPSGFLDDPKSGFTALAVDIGDADLAEVRAAAAATSDDRMSASTVSLPVPTKAELMGSLNRYREYLKMEYPRYYWNPNYEPWLPSDLEVPTEGSHFPRAIAKAIYGSEYYQGREIATALDSFAEGILASEATPLVVVAFSLAGGVGSGIVVEIARHLSSIKLGRRPWVVGLGIMPCDADSPDLLDGSFFPVINELDCMIDTEKNKGVMAVWGDLYKNPFTGGFFAVPQNDVHALVGTLEATHSYLDEGLAQFLARDNCVHLYESLKELNWLAVPAETWHPAIRGEQGERWLNVLATRKAGDVASLGSMGLNKGFVTEYAEARVYGEAASGTAAGVATQLAATVQTQVEAGVLEISGTGEGFVSVLVPRACKLDLEAFVPARDVYDQLDWDAKLLKHSWLLDLGVMLCEPSIRFDGMGGECIWGCACWVVVPHAAIRGEVAIEPLQLSEPAPAGAS